MFPDRFPCVSPLFPLNNKKDVDPLIPRRFGQGGPVALRVVSPFPLFPMKGLACALACVRAYVRAQGGARLSEGIYRKGETEETRRRDGALRVNRVGKQGKRALNRQPNHSLNPSGPVRSVRRPKARELWP